MRQKDDPLQRSTGKSLGRLTKENKERKKIEDTNDQYQD